jgi:hypothetical protein
MANPINEKGLLADKNGKPLLTTRQANVADAAATTATAVDVTFTANAPTAADTQTIADGDVPTVAELGQWVANSEDFMAEVVADLDAHKTKINAILDVLEAHGLMIES